MISKTTTTNDDPWLILLGWADEQVEKDLCHGSSSRKVDSY